MHLIDRFKISQIIQIRNNVLHFATNVFQPLLDVQLNQFFVDRSFAQLKLLCGNYFSILTKQQQNGIEHLTGLSFTAILNTNTLTTLYSVVLKPQRKRHRHQHSLELIGTYNRSNFTSTLVANTQLRVAETKIKNYDTSHHSFTQVQAV